MKKCFKGQSGRGLRLLIGLLMICCLVFLAACGTSNQEEMNRPVKTEKQKSGKKKSSGKKVEALADENPIPADGIITKERFETVAGENREIRFTGKTEDGISYTWIYDANQIQNPEDQNLRITFDSKNLEDIKKKANHANDALKMTMYGKGLICPPTLEVELPEAWQSDTGMLLKEQDSKLAKVSDVSIFTEPKEEKSSKDKKKDEKDKQSEKKDAGAEEATDEKVSIESLKAPQAGVTVLSMTVLSLDGDSYIVGGITDEDKLAEINQQIKNMANANANAGNENNQTNAGSGSDVSAGGSADDQAGDIPNDISNSGGGSGGGNGSSGGGNGGSGGSSGGTCTISINCSTILDNMDNLSGGKEEFVPSNGWILKPMSVSFSPGDSVHDILKEVCRDQGIHMESSYSPVYDSAYVEGINQLYEFDCGELSGWMYNVNGWFPNYGCGKYSVSDGDVINWVYTCDLGKDVGDNSMY